MCSRSSWMHARWSGIAACRARAHARTRAAVRTRVRACACTRANRNHINASAPIPARLCERRGQATVEAALIIPVLFVGILLLVQPGILLYDRMVMNDAAAEGCRLVATSSEDSAQICEDYIRRRLSAVPQQDNLHVHSSGCSWQIECSGSGSTEAFVSITNEVEPLPLIGAGANLLGVTNDAGNFEVHVEMRLDEQPSWVSNSPAGDSSVQWVGAWLS